MDENSGHMYEMVGNVNPAFKMAENASYGTTKHDLKDTIDCEKKSDDKKSGTGKLKQLKHSKVAVVLAVATCCSILTALCSLGIAIHVIMDLQTHVDEMGSLLSAVNTTQSQVRILTDDVSGLTAAMSTISNMIMEINNVSRGPPGENYPTTHIQGCMGCS